MVCKGLENTKNEFGENFVSAESKQTFPTLDLRNLFVLAGDATVVFNTYMSLGNGMQLLEVVVYDWNCGFLFKFSSQ